MKIAILGAGAMGCLYYAKLAQANFSPVFIADIRAKSNSSKPRNKVTLEDKDSCLDFALQTANTKSELLNSSFILVTLKAFQVEKALEKLKPWLTQQHIICLMHNGMGVVDKVAKRLPKNPILVATTTQAALKIDTYKVKHTGDGETYIGPHTALSKNADENFKAAYKQLNSSLGKVYIDKDITQRLYQKLSINCVINPLTAIYQCKNGQLIKPIYEKDVIALCEEISAVLTAKGFKISPLELQNNIVRVAQATASNYSSMHQDIFLKRPTEIEHITGYLLQQAKTLHIASPKNNDLYLKIKKLEKSYL